MAIKISGNTVIDDSRNITSSGTMSANAYIGDGSQLTNLPGGGNTLAATASGTLADGSTVIVNTDGTVSVVAPVETTGPGAGSPEVFESSAIHDASATYDSTNNKIIIAYQDTGNSSYGTAVVGEVSGNSITFGTPGVFEYQAIDHISLEYDSNTGKVVMGYRGGGNGKARVGTVSGNSITFGSSTTFESASSQDIQVKSVGSGKVVIAYQQGGSPYYGKARVGTISGTSISFGTEETFNSALTVNTSVTYDSSNNKVVIAYSDGGNSRYGTAIVGTVSGTDITFGTAVAFNSAMVFMYGKAAIYDSANGKVVIGYRDVGNSDYGTAVVGEVSGTSISFGTPVVFNSSGNTQDVEAVYDSSNQKVVIAYKDYPNSSYGTAIVGTVSGTSISFGSPTVFESGQTEAISVTYDSTNQKVVIAYRDGGNSDYGTAAVLSTAGVSIPRLGSGTVFTSYDARFISAAYNSYRNKVIVVYRDHNNSFYGTAVVGIVSGTSISFGTPAVFESAATLYTSVTFTDYSVVIAYTDVGNSNAGTIVRCITSNDSTDITFAGHRVFNSGATYYPSITYDSSNDRVIIAYQDSGDSDKGKAIVARTAGLGFALGTAVEFNSAHTSYISSTFDSSNNKAVISYRNGTNTFGTSIVGTVSGDVSISFGSPTTFEVGSTNSISSTFDSSNNKVVIAYQDQSNSNRGTAVVGTVSGTGISFGTPVVFNTAMSSYISAVYDSLAQKVVIAYNTSTGYGTVIAGTVSGTSISFGNSIEFRSASGTFNAVAYDSTNQKVVIAYADGGNSNYGTSVVFSPVTMGTNLTTENYIGISDGAYTNGQSATIQLAGSVDDAQSGLTPGSKYYVQNNGTLSTSAGSPSVFAGTAVATTKLIVKN